MLAASSMTGTAMVMSIQLAVLLCESINLPQLRPGLGLLVAGLLVSAYCLSNMWLLANQLPEMLTTAA